MKLTTIYNKVINESIVPKVNEGPSLSNMDKKVLDFILGETLEEADGNKIINRLLSLIDSGKRKLITGAVIATLLSSAAFNSALAQAPTDVKNKIEQVISTPDSNGPEKMSSGVKINNSVYADSFSNNFSSGSYELSGDSVMQQLEGLKAFLLKSPNNDYEIKVTASESQVPNQGGLKVGELAAKRAKVLTNIIKSYLNDNGITNVNVSPQIRVGDVKWDGKNKDDQKYVKDQFVQMDVIGVKNDPSKKGFVKVGQQAGEESGYIDSVEELKGSGELTFSPGWIPDRLVIYKGDKIAYDTGYFVDKKMASQYEQWNFTPIHIASLTKMLVKSPDSDASKTNTIKTFETFNQLIDYMLKDKKYNFKIDRRREIKDGLLALQELWDSGQRNFMFYSAKHGQVKFEIKPNDNAQIKVFSPISDTEYNYEGYQIINGKRVSLEKIK